MTKRQMKYRSVEINDWDTTQDLINQVESICKDNNLTTQDIRISLGDHYANFEFQSPETDAEVAYRIQGQKNQEANERAMYERLRKKYER